jgi:integrase
MRCAGSGSTSRPARSWFDRQWNAKTQTFTLPKHGVIRTVALTDPARQRLLALPRESEYVFTTLRGSHYGPSSRSHHWNRVRCAAGLGNVDLRGDPPGDSRD